MYQLNVNIAIEKTFNLKIILNYANMLNMLIYKITNLVNGKVYIGQTSGTILHRWSQHPDKCCQKLYNAIMKYGKSNFKIEEIDISETQEELNNKEKYWIKFYNSMENGYNIQEGGYKGRHSEETKKKISEALKGSNNYWYGKKQSKEMLDKRSKALLGKKHSEQRKINSSLANTQRFEILCIQNGQKYHSIREASRQLNLLDSHICGVLKGNRTHTGGYTFEYVEKDLNCPKKINLTYEERRQRLIGRVMKNSKQLYCNNGKIYESLSREKLDCNISTCSIIKHLIGRDKTAKGYIFSYEPLDSSLIKTDQQIKKYYQETKGKGIPKSIIDNYGNIYTSIKQASLKLGMSQSSILRVLRGVQLECKGYSFKYS